MAEQNLRKRFELRCNGNKSQGGASTREEPMEVDHMHHDGKCFKCKSYGHKIRYCPRKELNLVEKLSQASR